MILDEFVSDGKSTDHGKHNGMKFNTRLKMDCVEFLKKLDDDFASVAFFDPQYRGLLDEMNYGQHRQNTRHGFNQMDDVDIKRCISLLERAVKPSGHLFLWMDNFHLSGGSHKDWWEQTDFNCVDLVVWDKNEIGMGYRLRRTAEFCMVFQKSPKRVKGIWKDHGIRDVYRGKPTNLHYHAKPIELQRRLIEACTERDDVVIDPCAGSFSVMKACVVSGRKFLGCDLRG